MVHCEATVLDMRRVNITRAFAKYTGNPHLAKDA